MVLFELQRYVPQCTLEIAQEFLLKIALVTRQRAIVFHQLMYDYCLVQIGSQSYTVNSQWKHIVHCLQLYSALMKVDH